MKGDYMYKITCYRTGTIEYPNMKGKGCFIREFDSIESIAKYASDSMHSLAFSNLEKELTVEERHSLYKKYYSLLHKGRNIIRDIV